MQEDFREPLLVDDAGFYITVAQMNFFLNREEGSSKFKNADPEFQQYYLNCCMYNYIYDMLEDDPSCAKIYWDDREGCVAVSYPMNGKIARNLTNLGFGETDDLFDEDDDFGIIE